MTKIASRGGGGGGPALRRFAAVSPFCFGYPAQPDKASWRIRIIHILIPGRFCFATRRQGRSEGFLLHASGLSFGFQARCTAFSPGRHATRTNSKDIDFRSVQLSNDAWKRGMDQEDPSTTSIDRRAGERVHGRSSEPLLSCSLWSSTWSFLFLRWWTWGTNGRSFTTEEVDSSLRLLLEQTTSTPRCRSGECSHNQLVSLSLAVLYFNLHFRCLPLMHKENYQSLVTAEADGLQQDSAFGVTSEVTSQNVEGGTEPSLNMNCFIQTWSNCTRTG